MARNGVLAYWRCSPVVVEIYNLSLEVVVQNRLAIQDVPLNMMSPQLCTFVVQKNGLKFYFLMKMLKNYQIFYVDDERNSISSVDYESPLSKVIYASWTRETVFDLCLEAVKQDILALNLVPKGFKSKIESFLKANEQNSLAPESVLNDDQIDVGGDFDFDDGDGDGNLKLVRRDDLHLMKIESNLRTDIICENAVKQNCEALKFVPDQQKTEDLLLRVVNYNGM